MALEKKKFKRIINYSVAGFLVLSLGGSAYALDWYLLDYKVNVKPVNGQPKVVNKMAKPGNGSVKMHAISKP